MIQGPDIKNDSLLPASLWSMPVIKVVLSQKTIKDTDFHKVVIQKHQHFYQVERFTQTQVFHENLTSLEEVKALIEKLFPVHFL